MGQAEESLEYLWVFVFIIFVHGKLFWILKEVKDVQVKSFGLKIKK